MAPQNWKQKLLQKLYPLAEEYPQDVHTLKLCFHTFVNKNLDSEAFARLPQENRVQWVYYMLGTDIVDWEVTFEMEPSEFMADNEKWITEYNKLIEKVLQTVESCL